MKRLKLVNNSKYILLDDYVHDIVKSFRWYVDKDMYPRYTEYSNGKQNHLLHRFIFDYILGIPRSKNQMIDHINGNKLDNRIKNLRVATSLQNVRNRPKEKCNQSGYKGVCPTRNKRNPWRAYISVRRKQIHLGYFKTKKEAAKAYDKKASELFKEYAFLNLKGKK